MCGGEKRYTRHAEGETGNGKTWTMARPVHQYARASRFVSSRRRHTRCSRDWSSDVCSSDLADLLVQGKAILVIGEVNTGDDKPKIFPQEIMALEDAPRKFTKQVHLRLNTAHLTPDSLESVRNLIAAHSGKCPLFLCFVRPTGEIVF